MTKTVYSESGKRTSKQIDPQSIAILVSYKTGFRTKLVRLDKGHFILIKGTIHQEKRTIINIYAPNFGAPNYIKHYWTQKHRQTPTY
jgi:hypothetical protein